MTQSSLMPFDPDFELCTPADLLGVLASWFESAPAPPDPKGLRELIDARLAEPDDLDGILHALDRHLELVLPPEPPNDPDAREEWLRQIERWVLARDACTAIEAAGFPWADAARAALEAAVAPLVRHAAAIDDAWRYARVAAERTTGLGRPVEPWPSIRTATATGAFHRKEIDPEEVVLAWCTGELHSDDEVTLRREVSTPGRWRDAYRDHLTERWSRLFVERGDPRLDIDDRPLVARGPLPHLGPEARLEARRAGDDLAWSWPGAPSRTTPCTTGTVRLDGDEVTGPIDVAIEARPPAPVQEAWRAVCGLRAVAAGEGSDQAAMRVALAAIDHLGGDAWRAELRAAAAAFREADESRDDELRRWVHHALEARLLLNHADDRFMSPEFVARLADLDARLADAGEAMLLLGDEEYEELTTDESLAPDTWWGARADLEDAMSDEVLDDALNAVRTASAAAAVGVEGIVLVEPDGSRRVHPLPDAFASAAILEAFRRAKSPDPGVRVAGVHLRTPPETTRPGAALRLAAGGDDIVDLVRELATLTGTARSERWREALVRISATPCPWLCGPLHEAVDALRTAWSGTEDESSALALAKMTAPTAGRVPLLVSERDHRRGRVLELRISRRADGTCGDPWEGAGPFALEARDAVLAAYDAAKSLTYTRGAPRELYGHRIDVLGIADPENCSIEGNSLALPAFLAFVSLWCDRPLDDVAATARPRAYDDGRPADDLGPVSGFPGKANALAEWAAGRPCRLLLHPACERVPALPAVERVDVRTWKDAAAAVGLLDTLADLEGTDAGDTPAIRAGKLEKLLTEFNDEVRNQDLGRHSCAGDSPWAVLATRMQDVLDELREGPARPSTDPETLARGSAYAALAYNYAGRDVPTKLLEGLSEEILQEVPEARLLRDVAALASAVSQDRRAEWDTLAQTLRSTLDALDKPARNRVGGMALGTLGRVHLHAGRIDLAVELLAEAVDHHARYAPHETPRSRCYHAAALRRADRLEESLEEIDRAVEELASVKYAAYRATTEMFLRYERARTLAAMNRLDDAARDLGSAEQAAKARGWGPRPGILRERVWIEKRRARAAEEGGRSAEAEAHRRRADELLAELDALLEPKSPGFLERIVAEAHADPRIDGEVY